MRVLMIAPQPFFQARGTPFSILHRLRAFSALGHQVDLLTYPIGEDRPVPNVRILRSARIPGIKTVKVGPSLKKIPLDLGLAAKVLRQVRRESYDLVHTHEEGCFLGAWISRRVEIPHLYDMHSSLPQQLENYGFLAIPPVLALFRRAERAVLRRSRGVIVICEALRDIALAQGASAEKLFLIHNRPVDEGATPSERELEAFRSALEAAHGIDLSRQAMVLYTGTFARNQGLEMLLESFARLESQSPSAVLFLVGGTPEQVSRLNDLTRRVGGAASVRVIGRRPVEEMRLWMAISSILVSPRSHGTNTPLKIYSYLQSGRPILATDLETHRQVLDSTTALLVPPTRAELTSGLSRLLSEPDLRKRLGSAAQRVARERYSEERYLERHRQMLDHLFRSSVAEQGPSTVGRSP